MPAGTVMHRPATGGREAPMGKLLYGASGVEIEFDDRTLTHVQIVIANKLRRRESFFFSWRDDPAVGDGRSSIWLDPSVPLYFKYFGGRGGGGVRLLHELQPAGRVRRDGQQVDPGAVDR
ncbi:hypothetical protein C5C33_17935, partial [Rathayibacter sp. AY1H3]